MTDVTLAVFKCDRAGAARAWKAARRPLERSLSEFLEPASVRRMLSIWWEPMDFNLAKFFKGKRASDPGF